MTLGENKKVIGMMNDEMGCDIMHHSAGLRLTMYSYKRDNDKQEKNSKRK